ncbi:hypothetical protein MTJW_17850 [Moorella thermoacetica]|nr:hypothetical protein MTJW_17850 [Moorella thermoacetica]
MVEYGKRGGGGHNYHNLRLLEIDLLYILFLACLLYSCLARGKIILLFHISPTVNLLSLRILHSRQTCRKAGRKAHGPKTLFMGSKR